MRIGTGAGRTPVIPFASIPAGPGSERPGRAVIAVPGEAVPVYEFEAPARAGRRALDRIVRFSLADRVSDDPGDMHIVTLRQAGVPLALVTARSQMDLWLAELAGAGITPLAVVPDFLLIDWLPGDLSIVHQGGRVMVRHDLYGGFCAEPDLAGSLLEARLEARAPARLRLWDLRPTLHEADAVDTALATATAAGAPLVREAGDPFAGAAPPPGADLLAGPYRPLSGIIDEVRRWRPVGIAAALVLVLAAASAWLDLASSETEIARLDAAIEEAYRDAFDRTGPIVDVRAQAQRALDRMRAAGAADGAAVSLPVLLALAGPLLTDPEWQVEGVQFHDATLFVDLQTRSFESLDRLRGLLRGAALSVETVRSSSSADAVKAQLALKGSGAVIGAL